MFTSPIDIPNDPGEDRFPTRSLTLGEIRPLSFGCFDFADTVDEPASGIASCEGDLDGQPVSSGDPFPTTTAGEFTLRVTARDVAGNETVGERRYRVLAGELTETRIIGHFFGSQYPYSTDAGLVGATARVPVQTRVEPPVSASGPLAVSIAPPAPAPPAPLAPLAGATAIRVQSPGRTVTTEDLGRLFFTIDASLLPADRARVRVLKDGVVVPLCGDPGNTVCVGGIEFGDLLGNGDWTIPVISTLGDISDPAPPGELRERFDAVWSFAVTPEDLTGPSVTLTSPAPGAVYLQGETPLLALSCADEAFGSGLASCVADIDGGGSYPAGSVLPTTVGTHTVRAIGTDRAGNRTTVDRTYEVPAGSATGTVGGGGAVSTGATATPAEPLQTEVALPDNRSGLVTIQTVAPTPPPAGYALLPGSPVVQITAPAATAAAPLRLSFLVDGSVLAGPPAVSLASVIPVRNGVPVPDCATTGVASPDPCVNSREIASEDGDGRIVVLTSQASTWALATRSEVFAFSGFLGVRVPPALNSTDAGETQRLLFRLGGNRGLDIFAVTPPASRGVNCRTGAPSGTGAFTPLAGRKLAYDAGRQRYTLSWPAPRAWRGTCREVRVAFRDGTSAAVRYRYS